MFLINICRIHRPRLPAINARSRFVWSGSSCCFARFASLRPILRSWPRMNNLSHSAPSGFAGMAMDGRAQPLSHSAFPPRSYGPRAPSSPSASPAASRTCVSSYALRRQHHCPNTLRATTAPRTVATDPCDFCMLSALHVASHAMLRLVPVEVVELSSHPSSAKRQKCCVL